MPSAWHCQWKLAHPETLTVLTCPEIFLHVELESGPNEAADLAATGVFRNAGSAEGKYFSTTEAGARSYATQAERAFGDPPYAFVRTTIPLESVTPDMRTTVDGGIATVVVPDNMLADLKPEFID